MNKFHTLGTKHEAYINRFLSKYIECNKITFNIISKKNITIFGDDKKIDHFGSDRTFQQFFMVLLALGFVVDRPSSYQIKKRNWDFQNVTNNIFDTSTRDWVKDYRNSRKICFLYSLNLLSQEKIKIWKIVRKSSKKELMMDDKIKKECSRWEREAISSWENIEMVIKRIKNEYKL